MKTLEQVVQEKQCYPEPTELRFGTSKPFETNDYVYMVIDKRTNLYMTFGLLTDDEFTYFSTDHEIIKVDVNS
jgi:hypothetical protein